MPLVPIPPSSSPEASGGVHPSRRCGGLSPMDQPYADRAGAMAALQVPPQTVTDDEVDLLLDTLGQVWR